MDRLGTRGRAGRLVKRLVFELDERELRARRLAFHAEREWRTAMGGRRTNKNRRRRGGGAGRGSRGSGAGICR